MQHSSRASRRRRFVDSTSVRLLPPLAATLVLIAFGWLVAGCGGREGTPAPAAVSDSAQVVFAGRPLEIPRLPCASAILIEPTGSRVLYEQNAHERRAPASIAKMTLELVVMREVEAGRLSLADSIRVSAWASRIGGSQAYLAEGEVFPLEMLMKAIAIHSANDACVAVAEHIAGTSDGFVRLMNQEVEHLGLENTAYVNVHGLDDEPGTGNYTTAYDIAMIGRELTRHPKLLEWSSIQEEWFRPPDPATKSEGFLLQNTNKLLGRFPGLDGLKTGYTGKAGFCLCASAERNGFRLISVILGADSNRHRFDETATLLAAGFNTYTPARICRKGDPLGEPVAIRGGKEKTVPAVAPRDLTIVVSRPDDRRLQKSIVPLEGVRAPVRAGQPVATLKVSSGDAVLAEMPVVAAADVPAAGFLKRLFSRG